MTFLILGSLAYRGLVLTRWAPKVWEDVHEEERLVHLYNNDKALSCYQQLPSLNLTIRMPIH